jgi:hypothetical protein
MRTAGAAAVRKAAGFAVSVVRPRSERGRREGRAGRIVGPMRRPGAEKEAALEGRRTPEGAKAGAVVPCGTARTTVWANADQGPDPGAPRVRRAVRTSATPGRLMRGYCSGAALRRGGSNGPADDGNGPRRF